MVSAYEGIIGLAWGVLSIVFMSNETINVRQWLQDIVLYSYTGNPSTLFLELDCILNFESP